MRVYVKYYDGRVSELLGVYSAVTYQDDPDAGFHGPNRLCGEQSMFPSMSECLQPTKAEREDGEGVDEGLGRIGGMGERKGKGETEGGKEGETTIFSMLFPCADGNICAPRDVLQRAVERWGEQTVADELMKARLWLEAKPGRKRKKRGIGMFLNNWLERSAQFRAERRKINSGTLLSDETTDQNW
jgi:hypothetical protein